MNRLKEAFANAAIQKAFVVGALAVGAAGLLSGAWQAAVQGPSIEAGLFGGAACFAVGIIGLYRMKGAP